MHTRQHGMHPPQPGRERRWTPSFCCGTYVGGSRHGNRPSSRPPAKPEPAGPISPTRSASPAARLRTTALIGVAGAIGAFGGVLVNLAFRQSFLDTHNGQAAYLAFLGYYGLCLVATWAFHLRRSARRLPGV
ncbi:hypothetical protein [Streptomyces sp. NPDC048473]|uniref:hypothetical protein n=1 Tax=unclassified Streptomyces TaxID=2593676 RepID=UPI003711C1F2